MVLTTHSHLSAEVEGRVELYICPPSGPSWPVLGRTFRKVQLEYLVMIDCVYEDKIWYSVQNIILESVITKYFEGVKI